MVHSIIYIVTSFAVLIIIIDAIANKFNPIPKMNDKEEEKVIFNNISKTRLVATCYRSFL